MRYDSIDDLFLNAKNVMLLSNDTCFVGIVLLVVLTKGASTMGTCGLVETPGGLWEFRKIGAPILLTRLNNEKVCLLRTSEGRLKDFKISGAPLGVVLA